MVKAKALTGTELLDHLTVLQQGRDHRASLGHLRHIDRRKDKAFILSAVRLASLALIAVGMAIIAGKIEV